MRLTAGTKLGPYEIVDALGSGGMGEVYRARDPRLRRDVAIKVVRQGEADPSLWDRLSREARAASALSHPNICAVFDAGESEGQPYLVMELLEGQTLRQRIGEKPMDAAATVAIAVQIADALEAAHAKGITHRDIKPGNVMIVGRGLVKVLDFGLAKQLAIGGSDETTTLATETVAGQVMGTPAYLSPEVLQGTKADARSDLWALGVVLYQMLSGRLPFGGSTTLEIISGILKGVPLPLPPGVPKKLRAVVERCLEKRLEKRYQTAGEIRLALEGLQAGTVASKPAGRTWLWAAGAAAVVAVGVFAWMMQKSEPGATLSTGGPASPNPQANVLFEQAIMFQRVQNDLPRAQELYQRALAVDAHFAEARRFHAFNLVIILLNGYTNETSDLDKAEEELRQVAAEAPDLFSLPTAQTGLYFVRGRQELIPTEALERVLEQRQLPDAALWRMILHMYKGENAAAKRLAQIELQRNSLFGAVRQMYAEILRTEGDARGAIGELQTVLEQAPVNATATAFLTLAYLDHGEPGQARRLLEQKRPALERNFMWRQAWALLLAVEGEREAARQAMDPETLKWAEAAFVGTGVMADFYAALGDAPTAIEWVRKAVRNGDERVDWFRRNPRLSSIQNDPAFRRVIESVEARRTRK